jgi:hypothetical protein
VRDKATAAGAQKAKAEAQLSYWQGQAQAAATTEDQAAADAAIVGLEADIAKYTKDQAAYEKEASRLEEANENSQKLAALAAEIASAKNATDEVVAGLVDTQDKIYARILAREDGMEALHAEEERLWHLHSIETDDFKKARAHSAWVEADGAIDQAWDDNDDDWRSIDEYQYNIRQVENDFRVTQAKLAAERTNAELMVAIKQDMNMFEDIEDGEARIAEIMSGSLTPELDEEKAEIEGRIAGL